MIERYQKPPEYRSPYPLGCICAGPTCSPTCPVHGAKPEPGHPAPGVSR